MARYRPHLVGPVKETVHALIVYKDFGSLAGVSHIGLGVAAMNNARILNTNGFWTEVLPLKTPDDLVELLGTKRVHNLAHDEVPVSHCVISAAWFPPFTLAKLARNFHEIDFTVVSHSNVGFLQADPNAFTILRGVGDLQTGATNIHLGSNSQKLIDFWTVTYRQPMRLLPNMYDLTAPTVTQRWRLGNVLRIGCFGAVRPLKNLVTAGAAALEIGARLQADLEFYISSGRSEGGGNTVVTTVQNMYANLPNAKLMQIGWQDWPSFRRQVRNMDLLLQPSYSESFNMTTADGIAEGVPSVTSDAIDWVPKRWIASSDDATDIADVGIGLLYDPTTAVAGLTALREHNAAGLAAWTNMLMEVQ